MELYKYTGSVAVLTVRFGKAETVTLYDSYDDSVAPVRLDVRGALAHRGSGRPVQKVPDDRCPGQGPDADPQQPRRARLLRLPRFHQHNQAGLDGSR